MNQGLVIFRAGSLVNSQIFHSSQWLQNLLEDEEWDVGQGRYQVLEHLLLFQNAQKLNLKQLKIRWIMNQQVLNTISAISFPHLKQLFLNGNNLTSIQAITQIYLPNLQNLNLKQNQIMMIGSLRRCIIPNLREISLYKNKICDAEKLFQMNAPKLEKIWFNGKLQDGNVIGSVTWVAKLESANIKSLIIKHNRRIQQPEAMQAINRKCCTKLKDEYHMQDDRHLNWL